METETSRGRQVGGLVVTILLWLVFLAGAAANSVGGFVGLDNTLRMTAGGIAVVCLVALIVRFVARHKD